MIAIRTTKTNKTRDIATTIVIFDNSAPKSDWPTTYCEPK